MEAVGGQNEEEEEEDLEGEEGDDQEDFEDDEEGEGDHANMNYAEEEGDVHNL